MRPSGMPPKGWPAAIMGRVISVSMVPGATALTRMSNGASSMAIDAASEVSAALDAL